VRVKEGASETNGRGKKGEEERVAHSIFPLGNGGFWGIYWSAGTLS